MKCHNFVQINNSLKVPKSKYNFYNALKQQVSCQYVVRKEQLTTNSIWSENQEDVVTLEVDFICYKSSCNGITTENISIDLQ